MRRAGGLRRSPSRVSLCHNVVWSVWPSSLRAGGGSADVPRHVPLPTGLVCTRLAFAVLAVLLERSRPIFRGARF